MAGIGLAVRGIGKVLSKFRKKKPSNFIDRAIEKSKKKARSHKIDKAIGKGITIGTGLSGVALLKGIARDIDKKNKDK
tara:strand:+ start:1568 stop:1801 length:234 start_codon:yes stop_codon:yes gene_type:complete